jgi:predicted 3-demethylubiquinone-9 3-methyltransferase (glyoxalase superfamily)
MPRSVTTFLMFEGVAEEAMNFYVSLFKGSKIRRVERWGAGEQGREGSVKRADFSLGGHDLIELNEAYTQLSVGGKVLMPLDHYGFSTKFGWVNDRFGVSWQLNWA